MATSHFKSAVSATSRSTTDKCAKSPTDNVPNVAVLSSIGVIIDRKLAPMINTYLRRLSYVYAPRIGAPKKCTIYRGLHQPNGVDIITLPRGSLAALGELGHDAPSLQMNMAPIRAFIGRDGADGFRVPSDFLYDDQVLILKHICDMWAQSRPRGSQIESLKIIVPTGHTETDAADPRATNKRSIAFSSACLNLRAGYGKTFIAAGIVALIRVRTLYIVPTRELAKQTLADLRACLHRPADNSATELLSIVYVTSSEQFRAIANSENVTPSANNTVCIAVINTVLAACSEMPTGAISRAFSLVIFDEAHTYCSAKRLEVFWMTQTHFMFGMSATVDERRDGFDFALGHHLFPMINAGDVAGFSYGENQFQCKVRAIRYYAQDKNAQNLRHEATDQIFTHYMYEQFARDPARNALVIASARELLAEGHNVFIFAEERAHVENIARLMSDAGVVSLDDTASNGAPRCVIFYGGVSDEERRVALCGNARVIVATYSYSGTGVSIIRMTAMILASPRYSGMKQIVGRILRRGSDVAIPRVIVDIIDQKTCLARQFRLRRNAFDFYGATYEKKDVRDLATELPNGSPVPSE